MKFKWTDVEQKAFHAIKHAVSQDTLLAYPDFNPRFDTHTDASYYRLGLVITKNGKPLAFYSRKLTVPTTRYTVTEK